MAKLFYSTSEVAKLFKVNRVTIYRWVQEGTVKAYRIGKHLKIPLSEVNRLLREFGFKEIAIGENEGAKEERLMDTIDHVARYGQKKKLVIAVDDDMNILTFIKSVFEGMGLDEKCELRTYPDAMEALLQIGKEKPDLILLDIVMPGLNGVELARKVRTMYDGVKIIIVTGYPINDYLTDEEKTHFADILSKPVDIGALYKSINGALGIN
ncbi:MAG TPA: response regulator [Syntrophales bacterium]|jgi:excisionase family DNA binding protein|nr:response regulator [Syntrophales bacterium]